MTVTIVGVIISVKNLVLSPAWEELGRPAFRDAAAVSIARAFPGLEVAVVCMAHAPECYFDISWGMDEEYVTDADRSAAVPELVKVADRLKAILEAVNAGSNEVIEDRPPVLFVP